MIHHFPSGPASLHVSHLPQSSQPWVYILTRNPYYAQHLIPYKPKAYSAWRPRGASKKYPPNRNFASWICSHVETSELQLGYPEMTRRSSRSHQAGPGGSRRDEEPGEVCILWPERGARSQECRNIIGVGCSRGSVRVRQSVSGPRTAGGHQLISEYQTDSTGNRGPCDGLNLRSQQRK